MTTSSNKPKQNPESKAPATPSMVVSLRDNTQEYAFNPTALAFCTAYPHSSAGFNWKFTVYNTDEGFQESVFDDFNIMFDLDPTIPEYIRRAQRAVLIVKMANRDGYGENWRFHGDGIVFNDTTEMNCRVRTKIKDRGTTLIMVIDQMDLNSPGEELLYHPLDFRFTATCVNKKEKNPKASTTPIYYSQDPSVGVGGGIHPQN